MAIGRDMKFRYVYQHDSTGHIVCVIYTLEEIEAGLPKLWQEGNKIYDLISRDQCIGYPEDVDVFENDIIENQAGDIGLVVWENSCFALTGNDLKTYYYDWPDDYFMSCKILGNKWDNPELLEKVMP